MRRAHRMEPCAGPWVLCGEAPHTAGARFDACGNVTQWRPVSQLEGTAAAPRLFVFALWSLCVGCRCVPCALRRADELCIPAVSKPACSSSRTAARALPPCSFAVVSVPLDTELGPGHIAARSLRSMAGGFLVSQGHSA